LFSILGCGGREQPNTVRFDVIRINLGTMDSGSTRPFKVCLSNPSQSKQIHILGVSESCECVRNNVKLPMTLNPSDSICISFLYQNKKSRGEFDESIFFHSDTDSPFQKITVFGVIN
jgi:hypothetical protein